MNYWASVHPSHIVILVFIRVPSVVKVQLLRLNLRKTGQGDLRDITRARLYKKVWWKNGSSIQIITCSVKTVAVLLGLNILWFISRTVRGSKLPLPLGVVNHLGWDQLRKSCCVSFQPICFKIHSMFQPWRRVPGNLHLVGFGTIILAVNISGYGWKFWALDLNYSGFFHETYLNLAWIQGGMEQFLELKAEWLRYGNWMLRHLRNDWRIRRSLQLKLNCQTKILYTKIEKSSPPKKNPSRPVLPNLLQQFRWQQRDSFQVVHVTHGGKSKLSFSSPLQTSMQAVDFCFTAIVVWAKFQLPSQSFIDVLD